MSACLFFPLIPSRCTLKVIRQARTLDRTFLAPLRQCVALLRNKIPEDERLHPHGRYYGQHAELVVDLAQVNLSCGLLSEAERGFTAAIEYRRTKGGEKWPGSPADLMLLEGLAVVRYRLADLDSSIEILEGALELAQKLHELSNSEAVAIMSLLKEVSDKRETMQQHHKRVVIDRSGTPRDNVEASGKILSKGDLVPPSHKAEAQLLDSEQNYSSQGFRRAANRVAHQPATKQSVSSALPTGRDPGLFGKRQIVLRKLQLEGINKLNAKLRTAATAGYFVDKELLLTIKGIDPNSQDGYGFGCTARSWATFWRHDVVVRLLLNVDQIDVNVRDIYESPPLYAYSEKAHHDLVQMLLERGADFGIQETGGYDNARQAADKQGHEKIIHMLLHRAAARGHQTVIERCLALGADVNATDEDGETALHFAAKNGHLEVVKTLIQANANKTILVSDGCTALDRAHGAGPGGSNHYCILEELALQS